MTEWQYQSQSRDLTDLDCPYCWQCWPGEWLSRQKACESVQGGYMTALSADAAFPTSLYAKIGQNVNIKSKSSKNDISHTPRQSWVIVHSYYQQTCSFFSLQWNVSTAFFHSGGCRKIKKFQQREKEPFGTRNELCFWLYSYILCWLPVTSQ